MATILDTLISAAYGQDALANHFKAKIGGVTSDALNFRILTFEIPAQTVSTYELTKRGRKMSRPSGVQDQSYEFSFTYRLDKNFAVYTEISDWLKSLQHPLSMAMSADIVGANVRRPVAIKAIQGLDPAWGAEVAIKEWSFIGAMPISQDAVSFDEENGEPLVMSVTMHCMGINYPSVSSATAV